MLKVVRKYRCNISWRSGTQYVAMVTIIVSSYCRTALEESYWKNQTFLIQIDWDILFHHVWSKFGWVYDVITRLICIFQKLEYLWNEKRYLKTVNSIFTLVQTACCCEVTRLLSRLISVEYVTSLGLLRQYQLYFRDSDVCKFVCMYACMYITAFASIPSNRNRGYFLFRAESHGFACEDVESKWRFHEFPRLI